MMSCIIAAYKNNHVCIVRKLTVSQRDAHKNQLRVLAPRTIIISRRYTRVNRLFGTFFWMLPRGSKRSLWYTDQLFLLKGKHGRLYGGCPPRLLYHTHNLKSMGENEMAQSWQKAVSRSPPPITDVCRIYGVQNRILLYGGQLLTFLLFFLEWCIFFNCYPPKRSAIINNKNIRNWEFSPQMVRKSAIQPMMVSIA